MIPKAQDGTWKLWLVAPLMSGAAVLSLACLASNAFPQQLPGGVQGKGQMKKNGAFSKADYGKQELKEPFKGLTADGQVARGLFPIRSTGVSTGPVREAAEAFLVLLTEDQRAKVAYPINDIEWRKWSNVSWYLRQGLSLKQMTEPQRRATSA